MIKLISLCLPLQACRVGVMDEYEWEDALSLGEWIAEFESNACCSDYPTAARRMCGCGGSAQLPQGVSRIIRSYYDDLREP